MHRHVRHLHGISGEPLVSRNCSLKLRKRAVALSEQSNNGGGRDFVLRRGTVDTN